MAERTLAQLIKAKYPQYAAIPDQELEARVLKQHPGVYDDLPRTSAWMQNEFDPTAGMSWLEKFNVGMGKAFTDIGRGAGRLIGVTSPEDVRESRRLDAPLMKHGAARAGHIAGNIAAFAPAAMIPGANTVAGAGAIGATMAALQPTTSTAEQLFNEATGLALGAGTQAVARYPLETAQMAKKVIGTPVRVAKSIVEPFYGGGRTKIAARTLQQAIGPQNVPRVQANLMQGKALVPGSEPTAAEVGNSGGLASLQRAASAVTPEPYAARVQAQDVARTSELQDLAGTFGEREFVRATRDATADQLYEQARQVGIDMTKLTPARQGEITKLMRTPAIQQALREAKNMARNEMKNVGDPAGSVRGLDYLQRALGDMIGNAQGNERRILTGLRDRLLTTIDTMSPEFAAARGTYAQMSRPVTEMDVIQAIADKSVRPLDMKVMPQQYARALSDQMAQSVTGIPNASLASTISPEKLARLTALKEDLARSVAAQNLGRGAGSDTMQKLAMTNLMQSAGLPQSVANLPLVGRFGNWAYQGSEQQIREQLAQALLNPQSTAQLLGAAKLPAQAIPTPPALGRNSALAARLLALPAMTEKE